jgi:uncharacterized protein (TIGR04255 family)
LVAPIRQGSFTNINEFAGKILLTAEDGGCLLQHGVRVKASDDSAVLTAEYFIDIDTYRNEVQLDDVGNALHAMHAQAFDMFDWTLGPKARDYLTANKIVKS